MSNAAPASSWQEIRNRKRAVQLASIPSEWRLLPEDAKPATSTGFSSRAFLKFSSMLTPLEHEITSYRTAAELLSRIHSGQYSALSVTVAYCKLASILQQLTKCCTEMMFERAIATAKDLDEKFKANGGKPVGRLHGLPISLKDGFEVKGYDCCLGWAAMAFKPMEEDGIVTTLTVTRLGAVPFVKSNVPQSLMMSDSYNHVFGQSVNSLNSRLISGGSSGGEGALVGAGASLIGIGTDIGGSIRIPAALHGIYGLCPTRGRVPNRESGRSQKHLVPPVSGPLTREIETLETFMKEYLNSEPWKVDPGLLPIPWRDGLAELQEPTRKLKVAFVIDDGVVLPQPPITRAISYIRDLFDRFGHQTSTWSHAPTHRSAYYDLWLPSVLADGGKRCADLCAQGGGQPLIEGMLVGQPSDEMNVAQRQAHAEKIYDYQLQYLKQWEDSDIDAIIMPVMPWISYKPKQWVQSNQYVGYSSVWNLVDYAALAAPSGCVVEREKDDPTKVKHWAEHEKRNPSDEYNWNQFDLDLVEGMPVPVQIIGGRFGEETCVMVAKVLEEMRRKDMEKRGS